MRPATRFGLLFLPLCAALAQTPPAVAEILSKVGQTYKAAADYELVADLTVRENGAITRGHLLLAFKSPGRYRLEGALPGLGLGPVGGKAVVVYDGEAVWFYLPEPNGYASFPASALTGDAPGDLGDLRPAVVDHFLMWRYRGAADFAAGAKFLREETLEIAGAKLACYVVTVSPAKGESAYTWWVDKLRYRILREDHGTTSSVFTTVNLDEPPAAELFKFVPPAGARQLQMR